MLAGFLFYFPYSVSTIVCNILIKRHKIIASSCSTSFKIIRLSLLWPLPLHVAFLLFHANLNLLKGSASFRFSFTFNVVLIDIKNQCYITLISDPLEMLFYLVLLYKLVSFLDNPEKVNMLIMSDSNSLKSYML